MNLKNFFFKNFKGTEEQSKTRRWFGFRVNFNKIIGKNVRNIQTQNRFDDPLPSMPRSIHTLHINVL